VTFDYCALYRCSYLLTKRRILGRRRFVKSQCEDDDAEWNASSAGSSTYRLCATFIDGRQSGLAGWPAHGRLMWFGRRRISLSLCVCECVCVRGAARRTTASIQRPATNRSYIIDRRPPATHANQRTNVRIVGRKEESAVSAFRPPASRR